MSRKTRREASDEYQDPIAETLRCITNSYIGVGDGASPTGKVNTLSFVNDIMAPLRDKALGLFFSQRYELIQESQEGQAWKVRTRGYIYTIFDCSHEKRREIVSYQWHPDNGVTTPHIHSMKGHSAFGHAHFPTGRVSIESIVRALIMDLEVEPRCSDWKSVLEKNHTLFEQRKSWH